MGVSKRRIERWAKSITSWEHGLARLGECVAHFQRIDEALNICISALIGGSRKIGEVVTSEMSFRAKIAIYSALCHHALGVEKLPQELSDLVADDCIGRNRNEMRLPIPCGTQARRIRTLSVGKKLQARKVD